MEGGLEARGKLEMASAGYVVKLGILPENALKRANALYVVVPITTRRIANKTRRARPRPIQIRRMVGSQVEAKELKAA